MNYRKQMMVVCTILFVFALIAIFLTGCTTTKTVEVPVPVPCTKPGNIPVPHDYMADLNKPTTPPEFVKACLATRESYKSAYDACAIYHKE